MKFSLALLVTIVSLFALLSLAQVATATNSASPSPSSGYATYIVQITRHGTQRNLSVNESVTPSSNPGRSILLLSIEATSGNFTYSRVVNSSSSLFPYLPAISNMNYTYENKSHNVTVKISDQGATEGNFQGKTYTLTDYTFSANIVSAKGSQTVNGNISVFPSDLVYSFASQINDTRVALTLTATSLALSTTSAAPAVQAASAGLGISLAVAAVALSLGISRRKHRPEGSSKPDHWVD